MNRYLNIAELERASKQRLPKVIYEYLAGGADDEQTLLRNQSAFNEYVIMPRCLNVKQPITTSTTVLSQELKIPLILAPTGMSRLFHSDGELGAAKAAAKYGLLYCLSSMSSTSIEDVSRVSCGPKMFQLYVLKNKELNLRLIERCQKSNYAAICFTLDVPVPGNRERDKRNGFTIPPRITVKSFTDFISHPRWLIDFLFSGRFTLANLIGEVEGISRSAVSLTQYIMEQFDGAMQWEDIESLGRVWGGPFSVKGILSVEDALIAKEIGASAIVVSNHGGRQLDGAPGSLDCLSNIVKAVADDVEIILDGGIRRGSHMFKAIGLGAKACMIGRPYLFGLAMGGQKGTERAIELLVTEFERTLALSGCTSSEMINENYINRRLTHY